MEIRLNKVWVIYSSANESGIILGKIPEKQQETYVNASKFAGQKYHYSTIFGAIQGAFKHGLNSSEAKSFIELERTIEQIAKECQISFSAKELDVLESAKVKELQSEIEALKVQLKKKVA